MKIRATSLLLSFAALLLLASSAAAANAKPTSAGSLLYVQQTDGGSLRHLHAGGFELELTGVSPRVATFTDRPRRRAGSERLAGFVHGWDKAGFAADPPNAALVLDHAPHSHDVAMLTLGHPHYDRRSQTLTYRVKPLHDKGGDSLAGFVKRADPVRAGDFGSASLFVDNGAGETVQSPITIEATDTTFAGNFTLTVSSAEGRADWVTPQTNRGYGGVQIASPTGLLLSRLVTTSSTIAIQTVLAEGGANFNLVAALELEGTDSADVTVEGAYGNIILRWPTVNGEELRPMTPGEPVPIKPAG